MIFIDFKKRLKEKRRRDKNKIYRNVPENHSSAGWHVDHIRPLSTFDLSKREEFLMAVHYTNLQPLWASENLRKNKKYVPFDKKPPEAVICQ